MEEEQKQYEIDEPLSDFKEAYLKYTEERNVSKRYTIEAENYLLKSLLFDYKFYICVKLDENGQSLIEQKQDEEGLFTLDLYSVGIEISQEILNDYRVIIVDFDYILEIVNSLNLDRICINPLSDNFKITNIQLTDLARQKKYNQTSSPILLHEFISNEKESIKLFDTNIKQEDSKLMKSYSNYLECPETDITSRQKFFEEFCFNLKYNEKFITNVRPAENGESRKISKIGYSDVFSSKANNDEYHGLYVLFLSTDKMIEYFKFTPENNMYISEFNFDELINLMDASHGYINTLRMYDKLDLSIPVEALYEMKAKKDEDELFNGAMALRGLYEKNDKTNKIEEELIKYFSEKEDIKELWFGLENCMLKGNILFPRYYIGIKSDNKGYKDIDEKTKKAVRKILSNYCFFVGELTDEKNGFMRLIWERN